MGWWGNNPLAEEDKLTPEQAKQTIRRALRLLRPYRMQCIVAGFVVIGSTLCVLAGPYLLKDAIDSGLVKHHSAHVINRDAIAYLGVALVALFLQRAQIMIITRVGEGFLRDLRVRVFDHIQAMAMSFFDKEQTGRLVSRMTFDIDSLQALIPLGPGMSLLHRLLTI